MRPRRLAAPSTAPPRARRRACPIASRVVACALLCGAMATLPAIGGCGAPARSPTHDLDPVEGRAALLRVDEDAAKMAAEHGAKAAFAAYLAEDAKELAGGQPMITGRAAIVASLAAAPGKEPIALAWEPLGAEVSRSGDLGYTWGRYELTSTDDAGQKVVHHGKYVTVWRRTREGWRIAADIGNESP